MLNVATESAASAPIPPTEPADAAATDTRYADYKIIRRNGAVVGFAPNKIAIAVTKAFIAVQGGQAAASARIRELGGGASQFTLSAGDPLAAALARDLRGLRPRSAPIIPYRSL